MTLLFTRQYAALFLMLTLGTALTAQHQELQERPHIWRGHQYIKEDSGSLLNAFKNGFMEGHFRYFLSATDNASGLTDYYAQAGGGGIRYESAPYKGFRFAVSGFFIFNMGSSDLALNKFNSFLESNSSIHPSSICKMAECVQQGWKV